MESKKNTNEYIKQKQTHRHRKQTSGYQRGEGRKDRSGYEISRYELLYVK